MDVILELDENEQAICLLLHELFLSFPNVHSKIRYKIPFYYQYAWVCYVNPKPQGGVELAFLKGHLMSNIQGVLESRGRKTIKGVFIKSIEALNPELVTELFLEALTIDAMRKK